MEVKITITEKENGEFIGTMFVQKGTDVRQLLVVLKKQVEALESPFFKDLFSDKGVTKQQSDFTVGGTIAKGTTEPK